MKIKYRPAAIADLDRTCDYLRNKLHNPSAAQSLSTKLLRSVSLLKENPYMGIPLSSKPEAPENDYRFLVVSKQLVFYLVEGDLIEIVRILDGRTDYLAQLFGETE